MPLARVQSDIVRLLAAHRDPEGYVAGTTPLNVDAPCYSADVDIVRRLASDPPVDPAATMTRLRQVLDDADTFVAKMPTDKAGLLFLHAGKLVQPDPDRLEIYQTHAGQRRGRWPSSSEIAAAMLERYGKRGI